MQVHDRADEEGGMEANGKTNEGFEERDEVEICLYIVSGLGWL